MISLAPTLFLFSAVMLALLSLFMFAISRHDSEASELSWWTLAFVMACGSTICFAFRNEIAWLSIVAGNALILWACGFLWMGVAAFVGSKAHPLAALLGGLVWLAGLWTADIHLRVAAVAAVAGTYEAMAARALFDYERRQKEGLVSTRAVALTIAFQACVETAIAISASFLDIEAERFTDSAYLKCRFLEFTGFAAALGFTLTSLSKERLARRREIAATVDPLTGVANRRGFDQAVERATRSASGPRSAAVLVFDLDNFKDINDRFGHAVGDRVLTAFGETAKRNIRGGDMLARIGGEEFAALLSPADRRSALAVAERIRSAFVKDAAHLADGAATVSVGVAVVEGTSPNFAAMTRAADDALYRAKAEGRNRVIFAEA